MKSKHAELVEARERAEAAKKKRFFDSRAFLDKLIVKLMKYLGVDKNYVGFLADDGTREFVQDSAVGHDSENCTKFAIRLGILVANSTNARYQPIQRSWLHLTNKMDEAMHTEFHVAIDGVPLRVVHDIDREGDLLAKDITDYFVGKWNDIELGK